MNQVLYRRPSILNGPASLSPASLETESPRVGGDALVWSDGTGTQSPAIRPSDISAAWTGSIPRVTASVTSATTTCFTAATFAQTKFGSTKMKTQGPVRPSKLSPVGASAGNMPAADVIGLHVATVAVAAATSGTPRLSPTGMIPSGRWNTLNSTSPVLISASTAGINCYNISISLLSVAQWQ